MIHRVFSSLPSFKTVPLRPGLNILLARRTKGASDRQTRNGVGKSSFVEIVHFLLGGDVERGDVLLAEPLRRERFGMDLDLGDRRVTVERTPEQSKEVTIGGDLRGGPRAPQDPLLGGGRFRNVDWRAILGRELFSLPDPDAGGRYRPTFRSLFSYFARQQRANGFLRPEQHSERQQGWDQQVAVSYLLGLDVTVPQRLQEVRDRERGLRELKKVSREGLLKEMIGTAADLRTQLTVSEGKMARLRKDLAAFQIVPEYREYEQEATAITGRLKDLSDADQTDREAIDRLRGALDEERPPRRDMVQRAYEEAGLVLPGVALRRYEEVERFHESVLENRRAHLSSDIAEAEGRIAERAREKERLDARRAQLMQILRSGGALEQYTRLQEELARLEAQTETLRERLDLADRIVRERAQLDLERAQIHQQLQLDHIEQRETVKEAVRIFEDISNALYERAGSLVIDPTDNGPTFTVRIAGQRSRGIQNMQIYCFDMMLMEICTRRRIGPGFLIHDSHLFDGVDERQVAHALELGARRAKELGFQYIVTMNDDVAPRNVLPGFPFDDFVVPVELTDAREDGGLFGLRFD